MSDFTRADLEARYRVFEQFAFNDQRAYYRIVTRRYRMSSAQVTRIRAFFALATGLVTALSGYLVQANFIPGGVCYAELDSILATCQSLSLFISGLVILSVVLPALGVFFSTLADMYQWERSIPVFEAALENIEVADALSPDPEMDDLTYRASLRAFVEGTLAIMRDESAQWEQPIKTPAQLEKFIEAELQRASRVGGYADAAPSPPPPSSP